jgi:WD40 repeat protein
MTITSDSKFLFSSDLGRNTLKKWIVNENSTLDDSWEAKVGGGVYSLITTDGWKFLFIGTSRGEIHRIDCGDCTDCPLMEKKHKAPVYSMAKSWDDHTLYSGDGNGCVLVWEINEKRFNLTKDLGQVHTGTIWAMCTSTDGFLYSCDEMANLQKWKLSKNMVKKEGAPTKPAKVSRVNEKIMEQQTEEDLYLQFYLC